MAYIGINKGDLVCGSSVWSEAAHIKNRTVELRKVFQSSMTSGIPWNSDLTMCAVLRGGELKRRFPSVLAELGVEVCRGRSDDQ